MNKFEYAQPKSIAEVFQYLKDDSKIKAGGVDLLDLMKEGLSEPRRLVNIRNIDELKFINEKSDGSLSIGPVITLTELSENEVVKKYFPSLASSAGLVASPQIRNSATLGGNLCQRPRCWYFRSVDFNCSRKGGEECFALLGENKYHAILGNDNGCAIVHPSATAVSLTALNASLVISDGKNSRTVPIADFYITPDKDITKETILSDSELITEILIPKESKILKNHYIKLKEKESFDWPLADVAVALKMNGNRCSEATVILGSAAPVPWISKEASEVLVGSEISKEIARKAANASMKEAFTLEQNNYKIQLFKTIVYRTICETVGLDPYA